MGALFSQVVEEGPQRFSLRSNIEIRQIEGSPNLGRRRNVVGSVDAKEEIFLSDLVSGAVYGRYDRYLNGDYPGIGADVFFKPAHGLTLFAGASWSSRVPTYEELYWTDSTVSRVGPINEEHHRHIETGAEVRIGDDAFVRAALFQRRVDDAILLEPYEGQNFVFPGIRFLNGPPVTSEGVEVRFRAMIWHLLLEGNGTYLRKESEGVRLEEYPEFSATGGIYFRRTLFEEHLDLKAGFRGRYQTSQAGTAFNGEILAYVRNTNQLILSGGAVDFVLIAHLGDAYVNLVWENLTEAEYFATPYYPVRDRAIRFAVEWEFLD
jgi:outer membrane receptor protein involved in Fe transport